MSATRELRLRSPRRWLIALLACASCATTPTPKVKPPQKKEAPARKPEPEPDHELEKIEADLHPQEEPPRENSCASANGSSFTARDGFAWPLDGVVIAPYGHRDGAPHDGIDIAAPRGTPIRASKKGEVLYSGERPGYGHMVILGHEGGMVTIYAQNEKNCVEQGAKVDQGEIIALVGESGGATSPAVHFEIRQDNKPINPRPQLPN